MKECTKGWLLMSPLIATLLLTLGFMHYDWLPGAIAIDWVLVLSVCGYKGCEAFDRARRSKYD